MALIYNKIVESNTEPSPNDLWLKDGKLKHYKGGWKDISKNYTDINYKQEVTEIEATTYLCTVQDPTKRHIIILEDCSGKGIDVTVEGMNGTKASVGACDFRMIIYVQPLTNSYFKIDINSEDFRVTSSHIMPDQFLGLRLTSANENDIPMKIIKIELSE